MSVAELHPSEDPGPDRTPPNDIAAEQSVLGAMLLSKDAIADVVEVLREGDFYRPAHAVVYSAILDLYGRGEPADAVTVAADLARTGETRPGGRRPLPAHPRLDGPHRGQRRLLRAHRARAGDPAPPRRGRHPHRVDGLHRHRRRRPDGRPRAGRGLRRHRPAHERGLRTAQRHHGRRPERDRGDLQPRRRDGRRAHRVHRARQAHQRPAPRAADHRRGAGRLSASRP